MVAIQDVLTRPKWGRTAGKSWSGAPSDEEIGIFFDPSLRNTMLSQMLPQMPFNIGGFRY